MSKDITNPNGSAVVISYDSVEIHLARGYFFQIGKGKNKHEAIKNAIGYLDGMRDSLVNEMDLEKVACGKCRNWGPIPGTDGNGACHQILPRWVHEYFDCHDSNIRMYSKRWKSDSDSDTCDCFSLRESGEK
jgi:hypothetical protein